MDDKLTKSIQEWLSKPVAERDIRIGADLLLRLNRNRILHQNILRSPQRLASKLEYELQKHLRIRLDQLTLSEVASMERRVMASAAEKFENDSAPHIGKRADHDSLPDDIRAIYERNGEVYAKMRQTYDTLRQMNDAEPCDRYEYLKILDSLDKEYRAGWQEYDAFEPGKDADTGGNAPTNSVAASPTAKEVGAARKFISSNRKKLENAPDDALRAEMQQRIDLILSSGGEFKPDSKAALEALGLKC